VMSSGRSSSVFHGIASLVVIIRPVLDSVRGRI
jgi:hypothetical protein